MKRKAVEDTGISYNTILRPDFLESVRSAYELVRFGEEGFQLDRFQKAGSFSGCTVGVRYNMKNWVFLSYKPKIQQAALGAVVQSTVSFRFRM